MLTSMAAQEFSFVAVEPEQSFWVTYGHEIGLSLLCLAAIFLVSCLVHEVVGKPLFKLDGVKSYAGFLLALLATLAMVSVGGTLYAVSSIHDRLGDPVTIPTTTDKFAQSVEDNYGAEVIEIGQYQPENRNTDISRTNISVKDADGVRRECVVFMNTAASSYSVYCQDGPLEFPAAR